MTSSAHDGPDLLLLVPTAAELAPIVRRLRMRRTSASRWSGEWAGRAVAAALTGPGGHAQKAVRRLLAQSQPRAILLAGFAGGLSPELARGEVIEVGRVVSEPGTDTRIPGGGDCTLLTARGLLPTPEAKRRARDHTGADAVDMEAAPLAALAGEHGLPFAVVRVILDDAVTALPAEAIGWLRPDGRTAGLRAARALLRTPWRIPSVLRLARATQRAGRSLATVTAAAVERRAWPAGVPEPTDG